MIYAGDEHWVPPLIGDEKKFIHPRHNPFFEHAEVEHFLAWRDGRPVGRVAAIHNHLHNEIHGDRVGFFGLFECIHDPEVARSLLDAAASWVGSRSLDVLRGPMNYSTNDSCGLLIDGFEGSPFIMMPYNPGYYGGLVAGAGFTKAKDVLAYLITVDDVQTGQMDRLERVLRRRVKDRDQVRVRPLDMKRWDDEVAMVRDLYNQAWERNWGFIPFTAAEFDHMAKEMKLIVDPDLVGILEVGGRPAGFGLGLPDANLALGKANGRLFPFGLIRILLARRDIRRFRVPIMGLLREYRGLGYDVMLYLHLVREGMRKGYREAEMSWILEDNLPMRRGIENLGGRAYRTYRIYDRPVRG
jgi:GNAT superfamily N-acetyltransferase